MMTQGDLILIIFKGVFFFAASGFMLVQAKKKGRFDIMFIGIGLAICDYVVPTHLGSLAVGIGLCVLAKYIW